MKCSLSLIEIENSILLCDRVTIDNRFVRTNWGRNILVALLFFNFQSISEIRQVANIAICSRLIPRFVTFCNFFLFKTFLVDKLQAKSHLCFGKYQQQYKIYFQDLLKFPKFYLPLFSINQCSELFFRFKKRLIRSRCFRQKELANFVKQHSGFLVFGTSGQK